MIFPKNFLLQAAFFAGAFFQNVSAQRGVEFGVQLIPQVTFVLDKTYADAGDSLNYATNISWAAGGQLGFNLTNKFGIGAGFLYSKQGVALANKKDYVVDSVPIPQRFFGTYLTYYKVPVYFKFNTSLQAPFSLQLMAGPQIGLLQKVQVYDKGAIVNGDTIITAYNTEIPLASAQNEFKNMDLGLMVALDGRWNLSKSCYFTALLRADYSLASIRKIGSDARNLTFGIQFGLNFVIGL